MISVGCSFGYAEKVSLFLGEVYGACASKWFKFLLDKRVVEGEYQKCISQDYNFDNLYKPNFN